MATATVQPGMEAWSASGTGAHASTGVAVVHGFTGNPLSTRPLGERLAADGFTVEVPRLPGHGTSVQDMRGTRYADWLAEVERVVDDLAARCDRVVVAGLSMGGTLSLDVAARRDLAGVVAINPFVLVPPGPLPALAPLLAKLVPVVPAKVAGLAEDDIARGGTERAYPRVPLAAAVSLTRALPRIGAQLSSITCPTLVAWSPEDHSVDPANARHVLDTVGATDVRELVCERSYHIATLDHDQQLLEDTVSAFCDELTPA